MLHNRHHCLVSESFCDPKSKSIEKEGRLVVARGLRDRKGRLIVDRGLRLLNGISFWGHRKILKLDNGDGCATW